MNILCIDIDSVIPNLALEKCKIYHKERGDNVETTPIFEEWADKIYVSCVFEWNRDRAMYWESCKKAVIGGTGYDKFVELPEDIGKIIPKINLGFTSRGCVRKCDFCFVPKMEGQIRVVADIYDIWDGKSKEMMLLDNNILALPVHFKKICDQLKKEKIKVDFNQGLDLRILYANQSLVPYLKKIRHKEYKFAWDLDDDTMIDKLKWLHKTMGRCTIYVYVGSISFEKALWKFNMLRDIGHMAHCMMHVSQRTDPRIKKLRDWVDAHPVFHAMTFDNFKIGKVDPGMSRKNRQNHKLLKPVEEEGELML